MSLEKLLDMFLKNKREEDTPREERVWAKVGRNERM